MNCYRERSRPQALKIIYIMSLYKRVGIDGFDVIEIFSKHPESLKEVNLMDIYDVAERNIQDEEEKCSRLREEYGKELHEISRDRKEQQRAEEIASRPTGFVKNFFQ